MENLKKFIYLALIGIVSISCNSKKSISGESIMPVLLTSEEIFKQDSLAFELCEIYGFDQGIRDYNLKFDKKEIMPKIDTINFTKMVHFIVENGYPNEELLGKKNFEQECVASVLNSVLLHNPHRLVNEQKYFDLFLSEVKKGNLDADYFATILDKYYWAKSKNKENRRVFYGSQFGKPCIQTKEATNKARIEIGLQPLEDSGFVDCGKEELNMPNLRK